MHDLLGASIWVFLGLTVILFGAAAWMMGQALALTWRSSWHLVPYAALLAASDRFLNFSLFGEALLSVTPFFVVWGVLTAIAMFGFRATRAGQMAAQYPWLFERTGPLSWRAKS